MLEPEELVDVYVLGKIGDTGVLEEPEVVFGRYSDGVSQLEEVEHVEVLEDDDELCDGFSLRPVELEDDEEVVLLVDGLGMYRSPHAAS